MNIVLVSSEVVPFAKTGGLADVAGTLPIALRAEGHQVSIFMPRYKDVSKQKFGLTSVLKRVRLRMETGTKEFNIFTAMLPGTDIPVYFIDKELYFQREQLYQENGQDYPDNAERFHYFCLAVLESLKVLNISPDVIHCNDWQTAMIPVYLKTTLQEDPFYKNIATIYTIHNLAYQGLFEFDVLSQLGLDEALFHSDRLEFWGKVNFSKGGLVYADILNTVSERYSKEIQSNEFGCGLDGLLSSRAKDLYGILNGLDYTQWNPETDPTLPANFSVATLEKKAESKKKLLKLNKLTYSEDVPVLGLISRLADQKGFDILSSVIDQILNMNVQFVLLGTGDPKYHDLFEALEKKYPKKMKASLKFDGALSQLVYAGSDMFLMPSHYEPCGLGQLISLKYGTVPIVRETGGLADTIIDADQDPKNGNGFMFSEYTGEALLDAVKRAVAGYSQNKKRWQAIQKRGMDADFSWGASARKYGELYQKALEKKQVPA